MQRKQDEGRKEEIMETGGRVVRPDAKRKHTEGGLAGSGGDRGVESVCTIELICTFWRKRGRLIRVPAAPIL